MLKQCECFQSIQIDLRFQSLHGVQVIFSCRLMHCPDRCHNFTLVWTLCAPPPPKAFLGEFLGLYCQYIVLILSTVYSKFALRQFCSILSLFPASLPKNNSTSPPPLLYCKIHTISRKGNIQENTHKINETRGCGGGYDLGRV